MSKFWQKKYTSKYTGAEIDAAVAKAGTVPAVTSADAGKALVVDSEGKIVAGQVSGGGQIKIYRADIEYDYIYEFDRVSNTVKTVKGYPKGAVIENDCLVINPDNKVGFILNLSNQDYENIANDYTFSFTTSGMLDFDIYNMVMITAAGEFVLNSWGDITPNGDDYLLGTVYKGGFGFDLTLSVSYGDDDTTYTFTFTSK